MFGTPSKGGFLGHFDASVLRSMNAIEMALCNIILVERHPPRLLHYFASPGELAPSFYVTISIVTLLILTLCFRMIHLQTACCGGNSATQEPHAAHASHRNTMPDLAPRPRRASSQPQRMGTQVSGGKDESKIRLTTAAQEYLMGWHKNPTEAKQSAQSGALVEAPFQHTLRYEGQ
jgi:hypothetical protein